MIGRTHAGELGLAEFERLPELVIERYHAGLLAEGRGNITTDDVRAGLDGALVVRNAFLSVPVGRLSEPVTPDLESFVAQRLRLTRYLVELGTVSHAY